MNEYNTLFELQPMERRFRTQQPTMTVAEMQRQRYRTRHAKQRHNKLRNRHPIMKPTIVQISEADETNTTTNADLLNRLYEEPDNYAPPLPSRQLRNNYNMISTMNSATNTIDTNVDTGAIMNQNTSNDFRVEIPEVQEGTEIYELKNVLWIKILVMGLFAIAAILIIIQIMV